MSANPMGMPADGEPGRFGPDNAVNSEDETDAPGPDGLARRVQKLRNQNQTLKAENDRLKGKISQLEAELASLRQDGRDSKKPRKTEREWPKKIEECREDRDDYTRIYKQSCWEENCSHKTIHPGLEFVNAGKKEMRYTVRKNVQNHKLLAHRKERLRELVLCPNLPRFFIEWHRAQTLRVGLNDLPAIAKRKIFQHILTFDGKLVHAISRLDPFVPPEKIPPVTGKFSGLLNKFHVGHKQRASSVSVTYTAKDPNELLSVLLVNKEFFFLGASIFYGTNTFAFSSLGEFGRFSKGIGKARRQRLQSIELVIKGNQNLTTEGHSRRTMPLMHLGYMPRLQDLIILIDESSTEHVRRAHESFVFMKASWELTAGQPNHRMMRSLRTVQGIDYIYQLRGLKNVQVIDLAAGNAREPVRDWSFVMDLERVVLREKAPEVRRLALLENLAPLLPGLETPNDSLAAMKSLLDQRLTYNPALGLHQRSTHGKFLEHGSDNASDTIDSDTGYNSMQPSPASNISSDSDSDSDSDGPDMPGLGQPCRPRGGPSGGQGGNRGNGGNGGNGAYFGARRRGDVGRPGAMSRLHPRTGGTQTNPVTLDSDSSDADLDPDGDDIQITGESRRFITIDDDDGADDDGDSIMIPDDERVDMDSNAGVSVVDDTDDGLSIGDGSEDMFVSQRGGHQASSTRIDDESVQDELFSQSMPPPSSTDRNRRGTTLDSTGLFVDNSRPDSNGPRSESMDPNAFSFLGSESDNQPSGDGDADDEASSPISKWHSPPSSSNKRSSSEDSDGLGQSKRSRLH